MKKVLLAVVIVLLVGTFTCVHGSGMMHQGAKGGGWGSGYGMGPGMMGYGMGPGMMGYGMGPGMMGYGMGPGMMGYGMGRGMMGYGMGRGMMGYGMGPGMMGYGMGPGMMGYGMGRGMMGYGMGMYFTSPKVQKFLDETKDLRKEIHLKKFEYFETIRNPKTSSEAIEKLQQEMRDLTLKLYEKFPAGY